MKSFLKNFLSILRLIANVFVSKKEVRFRRIYATADRHHGYSNGSVKLFRHIFLHSQVRTETHLILFGKTVYTTEHPDHESEMCGRFLEEDTDTDTAENVTRFLRNANPENLPLIGETEESMFPILNKRVTDFLTLVPH